MQHCLTRSLIVIILLAFAVRAMACGVQYTVTDLGTLGGPNVNPTGINSQGHVVGTADGAVSGTGFAYLWTAPGPMINLGALGSLPTQSNGNGINDVSWVVGQSNREAFLYTPQTGMQGVGFLPGGTVSEANCVNNAGVISGVSGTVGDTYLHPFIWSASGGMKDLDSTIVNMPSAWTPTSANLINDSGLIAGIGYPDLSTHPPSGTEHAFVLNGGTLTEIPNPGDTNGIGIQPSGINSSGEVVGFFFDVNNKEHAFTYDTVRGTRDIGTLGGATLLPLM